MSRTKFKGTLSNASIILVVTFFVSAFCISASAQEKPSLVKLRHGFGYTLIENSLVVEAAITKRRDPDRAVQRASPNLPDSCFRKPGITGVTGIKVSGQLQLFSLIDVISRNGDPVFLNCESGETKVSVFIEAMTSDGEWVIFNNPTDKYLWDLTNRYLAEKFDKADGNRAVEIGDDRVLVHLNGKASFALRPFEGDFYSFIYVSNKREQTHLLKGLGERGVLAKPVDLLTGASMVQVQLNSIDNEDFYTTLTSATEHALELSTVRNKIGFFIVGNTDQEIAETMGEDWQSKVVSDYLTLDR